MIKTEKFKNFFALAAVKQFIQFALVGVINTGVDFTIFTILHGIYGVHPIFSQIISYSCGVLNSYFINRIWTFKIKNKAGLAEFLSFFCINLLSLGVSIVILYLFNDIWHMNVYIAKGVATIFALLINFIGSKLFVFRDTK